jgi:hypothetical protein
MIFAALDIRHSCWYCYKIIGRGPAMTEPTGDSTAGKDGELSESPLVEKAIPDPSRGISLVPWVGLLGKSVAEGSWRLYLTIELDS